MTQTDDRRTADARSDARRGRRRAEQASVVEGLRAVLDPDEQLLAFARGKIAGGWRGRISVGPEAFFAPIVNVALTEKRLILQHIHPENGKPSEILPHLFSFEEISGLTAMELEAFGGEPDCRLTVRLRSELAIRLRISGTDACDDARTLAAVYRSLTDARGPAEAPVRASCTHCGSILDQPARFCPFCGRRIAPAEESSIHMPERAAPDESGSNGGGAEPAGSSEAPMPGVPGVEGPRDSEATWEDDGGPPPAAPADTVETAQRDLRTSDSGHERESEADNGSIA